MSRFPIAPLVKFLVFAVITALLTTVLGLTIANARGGETVGYSARFVDATGLLPGDDVRIAGVVVGSVEKIEVVDRRVAQVDFNVDSGQQLPSTVNATIKYRNLIGQRYVSLDQGAGPTGETLPAGGQIPIERTRPALNLTVLFNGFQPLFQGLDPDQINKLSLEIVQVLQGEGGTVQSLLASTASLTNSIANRDQVIGQVIDNLNLVLETVNRNDAGLNELISSLQALVSGLAQDRKPIGDAIESIGTLTQVTGDFVEQARPPLKDDIRNLGDLATQLDQGRPAVERFLQLAPYKLNKIARVGSYGSWFQFYLCQLEGGQIGLSTIPGFPQIQLPNIPIPEAPKDDAPRCGADPDQDGLSVANGDLPTAPGQGGQGGWGPSDNRAAAPEQQEPTTSSLDSLVQQPPARQTDSSSDPAAPLLPATPGRQLMAGAGERRPVLVATIGIVLIIAIVLVAFNYKVLFGGGTTYSAEFTEAAGLQADDQVTVAGVEVGRVQTVELDGDHVLVTFNVADAWVGNRTTASIEIRTLLGSKFLALDPRGDAEQDADDTITRDRTKSPFDVVEAFNGLSGTIDQLDTTQLATSLTTLADTFRDTPDEVRGTLDGLSRLSKTISSRDAQLKQLLAGTRQLATTLANRRGDVVKLINDGNLLLGELQARKDAIANLLDGTKKLSIQLRGLVADNKDQLRPTLETLDKVLEVLERNRDNLGELLDKEAVFLRVFGNALSNGRWFDNYTCGLLPPPIGPIGGGC